MAELNGASRDRCRAEAFPTSQLAVGCHGGRRMTDAVWAFAHHVANTRLEDVPAEAVAKAKTYLLDSLGVGVVGSAAPWVDELIES
ncbi:MAG: MmgE/PrpD family protein, partial [Alphaproteobacteria bacterium]